MKKRKLGIKLGFPKTFVLSVIGLAVILFVLYFFREGIFFLDGKLNLNDNFLYKIFFFAFLGLSFLISFHLLILTFRIKILTLKIRDATSSEEIQKIFSKRKFGVFNNIWLCYKETIDNFNGKQKTRADADLYFNSEDIANKSFLGLPVLDFIRIISGTFIGLGILGTFIGFSNAIPNDYRFDSLEALRPLLYGLKTAFNTSIVGVLSSIIYSFLIAHPLILSLEKNSRELSDLLDSAYYISDSTVLRFELSNLDKSLIESEQKFTLRLENSAQTLEEVTAVLKQTPGLLAETNSQLQTSVKDILNEVEKQLKSIVSYIQTILGEENKKISKSFNDSALIIKKSCEKINKVPGSIISIKDKLENNIENVELNLEDCYSTIQKNINDTFKSISDSSERKIESLINDVLVNKIQGSFATIMNNTQEIVSSAINKTHNDFENEINKSIDEFATVLSDDFEKLQANVAQLIHSLVDGNDKLVKEEIEKIHADISKFDNSLENITKETVNIPETINQIYINLNKIPEEIKKLQDSFIQSSSDLIDASSLPESISKIKELNDSITKREETLTSLMNKSGGSFKNAVDKTEKITMDFEKIAKSMGDAERKIESSNTSMSIIIGKLLSNKTFEKIINSLKNIENSLAKNVEINDKEEQ